MDVSLPKRKKGRQSAKAKDQYKYGLELFCDRIIQIDSRLDFKVSSRGWCYVLEEYGLLKSEFDEGQKLITDCRKDGFFLWISVRKTRREHLVALKTLIQIHRSRKLQHGCNIS